MPNDTHVLGPIPHYHLQGMFKLSYVTLISKITVSCRLIEPAYSQVCIVPFLGLMTMGKTTFNFIVYI